MTDVISMLGNIPFISKVRFHLSSWRVTSIMSDSIYLFTVFIIEKAIVKVHGNGILNMDLLKLSTNYKMSKISPWYINPFLLFNNG